LHNASGVLASALLSSLAPHLPSDMLAEARTGGRDVRLVPDSGPKESVNPLRLKVPAWLFLSVTVLFVVAAFGAAVVLATVTDVFPWIRQEEEASVGTQRGIAILPTDVGELAIAAMVDGNIDLNASELRNPGAGDEAGRAHEAGSDAGLHPVRSCVDEIPDALRRGDVAGNDLDSGPGGLQLAQRRDGVV
jgi:hypothetical protein